MPKYRKKPVVVEAFKYNGDLMDRCGKYFAPEWAGKAFEQGELHPCKPDIFLATYEEVMEDDNMG